MSNTIGTKLECTVTDYDGRSRSFLMTDSAWDLGVADLANMFGDLLLGLGFAKENIDGVLTTDTFGTDWEK